MPPKRSASAGLPRWIEPQLAKLVTAAPDGDDWLHEIKIDGYRLHARIDHGRATLLTRSGLDWTNTYPAVAAAAGALRVRQAYLDGEICALDPNGVSSFARMQAGDSDLVYFAFDLLHVDGKSMMDEPLIDRKARLAELLSRPPAGAIRYSDHQVGQGPAFLAQACAAGVEGIVSKRAGAPYRPGSREGWLKVKCLNREEFVIVGWTDPEGSRPHLGALLLGYYTRTGQLLYAGRAGTGMTVRQLEALWTVLQPVAVRKMPLDRPPPRDNRFGSPLVLSRVHWVRPELVAEVTYGNWSGDGLLRHVVFQGLRSDKPARQVIRDKPVP